MGFCVGATGARVVIKASWSGGVGLGSCCGVYRIVNGLEAGDGVERGDRSFRGFRFSRRVSEWERVW